MGRKIGGKQYIKDLSNYPASTDITNQLGKHKDTKALSILVFFSVGCSAGMKPAHLSTEITSRQTTESKNSVNCDFHIIHPLKIKN